MLEGTITFRLDDAETDRRRRGLPAGAAGSGAHVREPGRGPARLLVLHAPAMDAYFEELHQLWACGEPPSAETERELMSRYGMEPG